MHIYSSRLPHPHRFIIDGAKTSKATLAKSYSLVDYMYQEDVHLHSRAE